MPAPRSPTPDLALRQELLALQDEYIATLDTDALELWPEMFVEDCLYEIIPKENVDLGLPAPVIYCDSKKMLRDRVVSLRHANIFQPVIYRHFVSGLSIPSVSSSDTWWRNPSCGETETLLRPSNSKIG